MPKIVRKMHKANAAAQAAILPKIPPELLDHVLLPSFRNTATPGSTERSSAVRPARRMV